MRQNGVRHQTGNNNGESKHQMNSHHHIPGNANYKNQNYTNETDIG